MDEQELLHRMSVDLDVNIELLKDLIRNEKLISLIKARKNSDATIYLRTSYPRLSLGGAKGIVDDFAARMDDIDLVTR